ncbi:HD domain-containing protein [Persicimonas caeni]|uniref:HD domain-containing protein n=1 Tax=Persicimonas caeni TaxID=2292766 RepID=A0A4Y6Q0X2_PERCE|nr:HD family phosphohydrolase [Persicimonas caeni]QDG53645.1 HD domain-containing protein [Persicimonas caeni]QED34866.1 HD domain-containing protein [Persicimonas caeni]
MQQQDLLQLVDHLIQIGTALSTERNLDVLLEMVVDETRRFTRADGGTLFLVDEERGCLDWKIVQNETMGIRIGGTSEEELDEAIFRPIPLRKDGRPRLSNVSTWAANTGETANIADVYCEQDEWDFTGPLKFDRETGYRSKSMLVVPLRHHSSGVIGVLQLINAREETGEVVAFGERLEELTASLASQAAVAVRNAQLFTILEEQFEAFIRTIATAIDAKSPYTAGHVRRVVDITLRLADAIDAADEGPFADVHFDASARKALRVAGWMHDVGKVTTPEWVVDKATKLETIHDRIAEIQTRYEVLERDACIEALQAKLDRVRAQGPDADVSDIEARFSDTVAELRAEREFLETCNKGGEFMADEAVERVEAIAQRTWTTGGHARPLLTDDEVENLCIRKGTLTKDEIQIIRNHARVSLEMLSELPFTPELESVPEIAASHHEKLDGSGYPRGLGAEALSLPARILAVADIFEALTAADRPYKDALPASVVRRILHSMVEDNELDPDIVAFGMHSGVFDAYADEELLEEQRDVDFSEDS